MDFIKIKHDLIHQNEKRQIAILQALRWRLTKAESTEQRQRILTCYISADLFNIKNEKKSNNIIDLLKSTNETIRQFVSRLINTFASLNFGRSYLASNIELVRNMIYIVRGEKEDSFTRKNLIAALQKLSLRHTLHVLMINENTIDYLVDLLEDNESLSDYSLEYAVALFMNLTLKKLGKQKCINDHKRILKVLSELLGNSSTEAQNYVNGALYSILSVPQIRAYAREINLADIIKNYTSDEDDYVNKQREVIINKINSEDGINENELNEQDDEEDEDDEEDGDIMERELDGGEFLFKQGSDELVGEQLLISVYSINNMANMNKNESVNLELNEVNLLKRSITPLNLRQSVKLNSEKETKTNSNRVVHSQVISNSYKQPSSAPTKPSSNVKSSLSFNNRTQSTERQSSLYKSSHQVEKKQTFKDKNNVLVIHSNDLKSIDSYEASNLSNSNQRQTTSTKQLFNVNDSAEAFFNRPKVQRTPDHSIKRKSPISNSTSTTSNSYLPKYSIAEPRPSSANSNKSKNDSITSTLTQN